MLIVSLMTFVPSDAPWVLPLGVNVKAIAREHMRATLCRNWTLGSRSRDSENGAKTVLSHTSDNTWHQYIWWCCRPDMF